MSTDSAKKSRENRDSGHISNFTYDKFDRRRNGSDNNTFLSTSMFLDTDQNLKLS